MVRISPSGQGSEPAGRRRLAFHVAFSGIFSLIILLSFMTFAATVAADPGASGHRVDPAALRPAPESVSRVSSSARLDKAAGSRLDKQASRPEASQAGSPVARLEALPPVPSFEVTTTVVTSASPVGYLALDVFTPTDVGATDESIANFGVPTFDYGGVSHDTIGITSNGYVIVGGGDGADVEFINTDLPDTARPNHILAPFWTDLNPSLGGTVWIELLTDGFDSWTVVEWNAVPNFGDGEPNTAQVWIGWNTDTNPAEDIFFTYATVSDGDGGFLTVGAENDFGTSGDTTYFDGAGSPPAPSRNGGSAACDAAWPGPPCYEVDVSTSPLELHLHKDGALDIASTEPDDEANVGDLISYTFQVTNLASDAVTNVLVSDPLVPVISCPSGNPIPSLAGGALEICTGTYAITLADIVAGQRENTATADADEFDPVIASHTVIIPAPPRIIPTMSWIGLALMALLLGGLGLRRVRR